MVPTLPGNAAVTRAWPEAETVHLQSALALFCSVQMSATWLSLRAYVIKVPDNF